MIRYNLIDKKLNIWECLKESKSLILFDGLNSMGKTQTILGLFGCKITENGFFDPLNHPFASVNHYSILSYLIREYTFHKENKSYLTILPTISSLELKSILNQKDLTNVTKIHFKLYCSNFKDFLNDFVYSFNVQNRFLNGLDNIFIEISSDNPLRAYKYIFNNSNILHLDKKYEFSFANFRDSVIQMRENILQKQSHIFRGSKRLTSFSKQKDLDLLFEKINSNHKLKQYYASKLSECELDCRNYLNSFLLDLTLNYEEENIDSYLDHIDKYFSNSSNLQLLEGEHEFKAKWLHIMSIKQTMNELHQIAEKDIVIQKVLEKEKEKFNRKKSIFDRQYLEFTKEKKEIEEIKSYLGGIK